jgi:hypothetical protein
MVATIYRVEEILNDHETYSADYSDSSAEVSGSLYSAAILKTESS